MSNLEKEQSSPEKASAQFIKRIFPLELEQISLRQKATSGELRPGLFAKRNEQPGLINFGNGANPSAQACRKVDEKSPATETHFCDVVPSTDLELVGLALSGGGIRSATFNLGVIHCFYSGLAFLHYYKLRLRAWATAWSGAIGSNEVSAVCCSPLWPWGSAG